MSYGGKSMKRQREKEVNLKEKLIMGKEKGRREKENDKRRSKKVE
jgi:hypothetical protein